MQDLLSLLESLGPVQSYLLVFGALFIGCLGTPINSDLVLLFTGVLTAFHHYDSSIVLPMSISAIFLGDSVVFFLGQRYREAIFDLRLFRRVKNNRWRGVLERKLKEGGLFILSVVRVVPGTRTVTFLTAALLKVKYKHFVLYNFSAIFIWSLILHFTGVYAGENYQLIYRNVAKFQGVIALFLLMGFGHIVWKFKKYRSKDLGQKKGSQKRDPQH